MKVTHKKICAGVCSALFGVMLLGASSLPAQAQNPRLDIKALDSLAKKAAEVVDVDLDGSMLKLASRFMTDEDDREGLEIVKNLKGIYVKSFTFDKPGDYSAADLEAIRSQLHAPAWSRIVSARSTRESETTEVYLTTSGEGGSILGMAIIDAEPKELTVVNIVGPIDMDKLSRLEGKMGIPRLKEETKESSPKEGTKESSPKAGGQHEKPE